MSIALEALENGKNTHKSRVLLGFRGGFGVFGPCRGFRKRTGRHKVARQGKLAISGKLSILATGFIMTAYDFAG